MVLRSAATRCVTVRAMNAKTEKPVGRKAGWRLRQSRQLFKNEICTLREDEVDLRDGKTIRYAYLERAQAIVVVPVTTEGKIALVRQYRYPVDEWCLEVPGGGTHDVDQTSLEEVARKELREEVGAHAERITYVNFFYPANAMADEKCHVFLAEQTKLTKTPKTEASESIEIILSSPLEALEMARSGKMKTGPCALAVLMCEPLMRERGLLGNG